MKQLWFGVALLAALLVGSIYLGNHLEESGTQPIRDLDRAAAAARNEDWGRASALATRAEQTWQSHRKLAAALVSHEPLGQIDTAFAQLDAYAAAEDEVQFSALCAALRQDIQALHQPHSFSWWNLL